jgi:hypothetical protein
MYRVPRRLASCLIGLVLLPSTSVAQNDWKQPWSDARDRPPRVDVSPSVGLLAPTDWSDLVLLGSISSVTGLLEQVLVRDLRVKPDSVVGAAVTYWRGKHGFRVQAGLSRSSLAIGGAPSPTQPVNNDELVAPRVDTWFYDLRGAFGLTDYSPGRWAFPYAFVGLGGITYDLSRPVSPPLLTFVEGGRELGGRGDIVIVEDNGRQFLLAVDELGLETVFAINFGVGTDFRIPLGPGAVGLRVEVSDNIARSPVGLRIRELSPLGGLASDSAVHFGRVHHFRVTAGLVVQIGR